MFIVDIKRPRPSKIYDTLSQSRAMAMPRRAPSSCNREARVDSARSQAAGAAGISTTVGRSWPKIRRLGSKGLNVQPRHYRFIKAQTLGSTFAMWAWLTAATATVAAATPSPPGPTLYVATTGNDTYPTAGSKDTPFRTVSAVVNRFGAMLNGSSTL